MHAVLSQSALWFGAQILQLAILVCMYRRRIHESYPAFFYYILLQVLSDPFLTLARGQRWDYTYYYGYWATTCVGVGLSFFVLQEVFRDAFRPFEALRDLSTILFRWAALVLLLVAGMAWLSAVTTSNSSNPDLITSTILMVDRNVRVMLCGLVFFLLMFSEYLGISRRHVLFGVAVGFGFFSAMHMLVATALSHPTILHRNTLTLINSAAYVISCIVWLGYVAHPKTLVAGQPVTEARPEDWNKALEEARARIPSESFLDNMDKMVAQAIASTRKLQRNSSDLPHDI